MAVVDLPDITPALIEDTRKVLGELENVCPSACDAGIAHAVTAICKSDRADIQPRLVEILGLSQDNLNQDMNVDAVQDSAPLLPPRVALEHADAYIRLNAIERLMKAPVAVESGGESLEQALLRHFLTEDEVTVAVAAGEALVSLLGNKSVPVPLAFADDCVEALRKWTLDENTITSDSADEELSKKKKKDKNKSKKGDETATPTVSEERIRAVEIALEIAGQAARALDMVEDQNEADFIQNQLLQGIIAHLGSNRTTVESQARRALFIVMGRTEEEVENAVSLLLTTEMLLDRLRSCWNDTECQHELLSRNNLFRRYLSVYLKVLADALGTPTTNDSLRGTVSDALNTCLLMIHYKGISGETAGLSKKEVASLIQHFNACAEHARLVDASMLLGVITKLSSVASQSTYDAVCAPSINRLCTEYSTVHGVSKLRILMEAACRPEVLDVATLRLVSLASECIFGEQNASLALAETIIFVLALFGHSEQKVRKTALEFIAKAKEVDTEGDIILDAIYSATSDNSTVTSQIIMDGTSALPAFFSGVVSKSGHPQKLTSEMLKLCYRTACSLCASATNNSDDERWLTFGQGEGGCRAATLIMNALELSGESCFPLVQRYIGAGRDILRAILEECTNEVKISVADLAHSVARTMKGVIVDSTSVGNEVSSMIISTGPNSRGTRARSYSVGRSPGISFIEPYPNEMRDDILNCLSYQEDGSAHNALKKEMCRAVVHDVLGSQSWGDGVFKIMDNESRKKLLESLLRLWKAESIDGAGEAFLGLELNAKDVADLIRLERTKKDDHSSIIFLSNYIHAHVRRLRASSGYSDLVSLLFQTLEAVSLNEYVDEEEDEAEFARQCLLRDLVGLVPCQNIRVDDKRKKRFKKKDLLKWASLLVALIGGTSKGKKLKQPHALPFGRPKSLAFSLLTAFCSDDPESIVALLVPAMLDSIVVDSSRAFTSRPSNREQRMSHDIFLSVVPVYFKCVKAAGFSQFDLYNQVLARAADIEDEKRKMELYTCVVDAVMAIPSEDLGNISPIGCFIAALIAFDVQGNGPTVRTEMSSATESATAILHLCTATTQVSALTQLIGYAHHLLLQMSNADQVDDQRAVSMDSSIDDLETAVLFASTSAKTIPQAFRMSTAVTILTVVSNSLACTPVMNLIMHGDEVAAKLSLNLWQDLLTLQSAYGQMIKEDTDSEEVSQRRFWDECQRLIDRSLEQLQSLLPAHLFLASVAMLIEDGSDTDLCSTAIRLVSERAAEIDSESPEASLFLDMLPVLAGLLDSDQESADDETIEGRMLVQQSVFVAVEILARWLCLKSNKDNRGTLNAFTDVLKHASALIKTYSTPFEQQDQIASAVDAPACQIVCSAALCASTLVRLLTVRSIPLLPDLVGPLLSVLCSVNQALSVNRDQWSAGSKGHAAVLQVSILRALLATADSLPQFLGPYLDQLLSPFALLSSSLRTDKEQQIAVSAIASQLGVKLSQKIPARKLIPSLCKSLPKCKGQSEFQSLLAMMKESVQQAPRSEVPALRSWLLKALTLAYEFRGVDADGETVDVIDEANEVLLALVMKLCEAQLRPLYAKLREWRGDIESDMDDSNIAKKKHAFWSMSALLSSQLRSIFLPCLSMVVSDAVEELVCNVPSFDLFRYFVDMN